MFRADTVYHAGADVSLRGGWGLGGKRYEAMILRLCSGDCCWVPNELQSIIPPPSYSTPLAKKCRGPKIRESTFKKGNSFLTERNLVF